MGDIDHLLHSVLDHYLRVLLWLSLYRCPINELNAYKHSGDGYPHMLSNNSVGSYSLHNGARELSEDVQTHLRPGITMGVEMIDLESQLTLIHRYLTQKQREALRFSHDLSHAIHGEVETLKAIEATLDYRIGIRDSSEQWMRELEAKR